LIWDWTMSQHALQGSGAYGEPVGIVEHTAGSLVSVHRDGKRTGLQGGDPVYSGDLLKTDAESMAQIRFINGKLFDLGCGAMMLLTDPTGEPSSDGPKPVASVFGRGVDIVVAGALLLCTLPLLLLTALLLKLISRGPLFAHDQMTAQDGRTYSTRRFRCPSSRIAEGDSAEGTFPASRPTIVGTFMRATRIDELPRVIDLLRGDVSFMGPAPIRFFQS